MFRIIIIVLLLLFIAHEKGFAEEKTATPECVYTSTAKVIDGKLIDHKEQIDCIEIKRPNAIVSAITGEYSGQWFQYFFGSIFFIMENLL